MLPKSVILLFILLVQPSQTGFICFPACYGIILASGCVGLPAALAALGFGAGGVVAGSWAASWMSSIGIVEAGSIFATLQGLGAGGVSFGGVFSLASQVCNTLCVMVPV